MSNPFHQAVDDEYRGELVTVRKDEAEYLGWCQIRNYHSNAIHLIDARRVDKNLDLGAVTVFEPDTVHRENGGDEIRRYNPDRIRDSPYSVRVFESRDFLSYVRRVRERESLGSYPVVREIGENEEDLILEIVTGHRRVEAARRAGIRSLPVRVRSLDDWEAALAFIDEHIPITVSEATGAEGSEQGYYAKERAEKALGRLRERWGSERINSLPAVEAWREIQEEIASNEEEEEKEQTVEADGDDE